MCIFKAQSSVFHFLLLPTHIWTSRNLRKKQIFPVIKRPSNRCPNKAEQKDFFHLFVLAFYYCFWPGADEDVELFALLASRRACHMRSLWPHSWSFPMGKWPNLTDWNGWITSLHAQEFCTKPNQDRWALLWNHFRKLCVPRAFRSNEVKRWAFLGGCLHLFALRLSPIFIKQASWSCKSQSGGSVVWEVCEGSHRLLSKPIISQQTNFLKWGRGFKIRLQQKMFI